MGSKGFKVLVGVLVAVIVVLGGLLVAKNLLPEAGGTDAAGDCENPKRSHGSGRHSGADALGRGRDVRSLIDIGNPGIANYRKERNCEKHSRQVRDRRASAGRCERAGRLARVRRQDYRRRFPVSLRPFRR